MPKIKTKASKEAMRWHDDAPTGDIAKEPTFQGNDFDVRMQEEPDGMAAARKVVDVLKEKGVCLVQANAPQELVVSAYEEAEELYGDGKFRTPLTVYDDHSRLQVQCWSQALQDEERVYWVGQSEGASSSHITNSLRALAKNIADFGGGLAQLLEEEMGMKFDRFGNCMLSCYTGNRKYATHMDNCHGDDDDEGAFPDNGMRLTLVYFVNLYWDPNNTDNGGGLDVFLSDPKEAPESAAAAKGCKRLRIAPHADTLAVFLSERMAHQVIATSGDEKWFAMTVWCLNGPAMMQMSKRLHGMRTAGRRKDDDSDSDGVD